MGQTRDLCTGVASWLAGTVARPEVTFTAFMPAGGRFLAAMPLVVVHPQTVSDRRLTMNGAGGNRDVVQHLSIDVLVGTGSGVIEEAEMACTDLADDVRAVLAGDPSLGGYATDGSAELDGEWIIDPLDAAVGKHQFLAWRWTTPARLIT